MTLNKFIIEDWERIFKEIKLIRFVTKIDVLNDGVKLAELDNNFNIKFISFNKIRKEYGNIVHDDVLRLSGVLGKRFETKDIVYIRCDELELAKNSLASMARTLVEIGLIGNVKTAYSGLVSNYQKDGYNFEYYGYRFEVITENKIY